MKMKFVKMKMKIHLHENLWSCSPLCGLCLGFDVVFGPMDIIFMKKILHEEMKMEMKIQSSFSKVGEDRTLAIDPVKSTRRP